MFVLLNKFQTFSSNTPGTLCLSMEQTAHIFLEIIVVCVKTDQSEVC